MSTDGIGPQHNKRRTACSGMQSGSTDKSRCVVLKIAESRRVLAKPLRVGDGAVKLVTSFVEFELASLRSL